MKEKKERKVSIGEFMSGPGGQRFFNVAYSIGAAIVILGALFKILHVKGGDTLLAVGMGTEVLMFILTAFERPYHEREFNRSHAVPASQAPSSLSVGEPVIMANGEDLHEAKVWAEGPDSSKHIIQPIPYPATDDNAEVPVGNGTIVGSPIVVPQSVPIPSQLNENLTESMKAIEDNMNDYISRMEELNRNIAGLNTIYELQLKSASQQLSSIEFAGKSMTRMQNIYEGSAEKSQIFQEEADKLTENMKKLNEVYENMLRAMNVQNKA